MRRRLPVPSPAPAARRGLRGACGGLRPPPRSLGPRASGEDARALSVCGAGAAETGARLTRPQSGGGGPGAGAGARYWNHTGEPATPRWPRAGCLSRMESARGAPAR